MRKRSDAERGGAERGKAKRGGVRRGRRTRIGIKHSTSTCGTFDVHSNTSRFTPPRLVRSHLRLASFLSPFKNVSVLYLQANQISKFGDLKGLTNLPSLTNLALHGNPVAAKKHYRNYVVHLLPRLHKLDFSCITKKERVRSMTWAQIFRKKLKGKKEEDE